MRSASFGFAALLALAAATVSPAADREAPFAFAEQTPLVASCSELSDGVEVVLRNETATAQILNVQVGRITDSNGGRREAKDICGGLNVKITEPAQDRGQSPTPVGPGGDAVVTLGGVRRRPRSGAPHLVSRHLLQR